jgi:hypothetical protein
MQQQTLERRLELLKDEGYGYFPKEIVERLSAKYGCAKSTIYHDFATKPMWQPLVMEVKNALLIIVNRHEQLYRKAALEPMAMSVLLTQQKRILGLEKKLGISQQVTGIPEPEQAREN